MWAECGWVECGATKSNKANVGGVWGNAKKTKQMWGECKTSAKKNQKWQSKGQKQNKCG